MPTGYVVPPPPLRTRFMHMHESASKNIPRLHAQNRANHTYYQASNFAIPNCGICLDQLQSLAVVRIVPRCLRFFESSTEFEPCMRETSRIIHTIDL